MNVDGTERDNPASPNSCCAAKRRSGLCEDATQSRVAEQQPLAPAPLESTLLSVSDATQTPNIVIILSDDVGWGDMSCYGAEMVRTRRIDQLAEQGMRFTHGYAPGSVCSPSRFSMLTGEYPCRGPIKTGAIGMSSLLAIRPDHVTLQRWLKGRGYDTAHIGKWHLGYGTEGITNWAGDLSPGPEDTGFDYHFGLVTNHNDNFKTYVEHNRLINLKPGVTELPGQPKEEHLTKMRMDDEVDSTLTAKACQFIREQRDGPFFLCLATVATHTHVTPAEPFRGTSEAGQLGDYIHELDHHVGEIDDTLQELGLADNTILIFTSDNGGQGNDHQTAGRNLRVSSERNDVCRKARTAKIDARERGHRTCGDLRSYKGDIYEGGFRVPFVVRWPGHVPAGVVSDQTLCLSDMLATIAGFLNADLPPEAGGDSFDLSPVMLGYTVDTPPRQTTVLQSAGGHHALREGDWKLVVKAPTQWDGEKPTLPTEPLELYDLKSDPSETDDLAPSDPQRVAAMHDRLTRLLDSGHCRT